MLLIKNGLLVDTQWYRKADIIVDGSRITKIASKIEDDEVPYGSDIIDAEGMCILPGLIDAHTHYHLVSRGTVTADSFREGSRCAAFGGVTTVIDFADDDKKGNLKACAEDRIGAMRKEMAVDFSIHQGVYSFRETLDKELGELYDMGVRVIKLFTTYKNVGYMIDNRDQLKSLFEKCHKLGIMITVHCEDDEMIQKISDGWKGTFLPRDHADLRPSEVEAKGIMTVGEIALEVGCPIYIVHLSSRAGLEAVRELRHRGLRMIVETTPHYLFLNREKLEGSDGPLYVMTPPLRTEDDNRALQEALCDGEIQVVATDHCSFTHEQKLESDDCRDILPGIPGTEEMLPLLNTFGTGQGRFGLNQIVNLLSTGPAKAFGLYPRKGDLRVGADADIVIFDPDEAWTITNENCHSAAGYTPYAGMNVIGKVKFTYLGGRLIMGDGMYLGIPGDGRFVRQDEPGHGKTAMH